MSEIKSVFAVSEQYEGIYTTLGVFTTKELAQSALDKYIAEFDDAGTRTLMAKGMYIEELTLHA
jgi:hypothetical protein